MKAIIIKRNALGLRRPMFIDPDDAQLMVDCGEAVLHKKTLRAALYYEIDQPIRPDKEMKATEYTEYTEDTEDTPEKADKQTYVTRDMTARPRSRTRGR